jgi:2-hydroxy-3-keto-5-methylthiopentenyl-1-phosphate phosphatase
VAQGQGATSRSTTDPTGLTVVVDFDSAIAERNVAETLLTTFSGDRWWSIDEELERGTITSFEAVNAFFDLIAAVPEHELRAAARQVEQSEHARVAVDRLVAGGASVVVVSDSFGFRIDGVSAAGSVLSVPVVWHVQTSAG